MAPAPAPTHSKIVAAVEGGGTSFKVAVVEVGASTDDFTILQRTEIDSLHDIPEQTLDECAAFLAQHKPTEGYHALGLATFGPVGLDESSCDYGCILGTSPKAAWRRVNLLEPLRQACQGCHDLVVKVETDVNAPALAEYRSAAPHTGVSSVSYVTVGTGVGVGLVIDGKCVHGRMHPEGGHVPVQPLPGDKFPGYSWGVDHSPFRGVNTVEGLASSVALTERLAFSRGQAASSLNRNVLSNLPDDHEVWGHAGNALANLCATMLLLTSTEKIVLGGGVLKRKGLMEDIRRRTVDLLNGYLDLPTDMSELISFSQYGDDAGLIGAVVLAQEGLEEEEEEKNKDSAGLSTFWHGFGAGAVAVAATVALAAFRFFKKQP